MGIGYHVTRINIFFFYQSIVNDKKKHALKWMITVTGKIEFDKIIQKKLQVNIYDANGN